MDQRRIHRIHTSIAFSDIALTGIEASDFTGNVRSFFLEINFGETFKYIGGQNLN